MRQVFEKPIYFGDWTYPSSGPETWLRYVYNNNNNNKNNHKKHNKTINIYIKFTLVKRRAYIWQSVIMLKFYGHKYQVQSLVTYWKYFY